QRVCGHHGPVGIREVHADEPDRLSRHADGGRVLAQRPEGERFVGRRIGPHPEQGDRLRVPDVQSAAAGQRAAQRRAAAHLRRSGGAGPARAGCPGARACRAGSPHGPPAERAVRRPALALGVAGSKRAESAPLSEKVPVERRDIVVAAVADGVIQPALTFTVKSKAWGEIVAMPVQTGDEVQKGQLLAKIDPRIPRDNLTQAQANLDKARAQLDNAAAQLKRSEDLFRSNSIAETDYEAAKLAAATAQAAVVTATANLKTAQDAMEDTQVRAPITGTILELDAVLGTVISSPTLGGGTVILKMANLDAVQDSALV